MILYRLDAVRKRGGSRTIVDIAHLELESERIYALIGPNGAGKTTLLDMLAFLERPASGRISFMGQPVSFSERHLHALRRFVVLVDQRPILFSTTVYRNMEFGLKIRRMEKSRRDRIIQESLDLVGMRHMISAPAHKLSGGETQRIALARGLALSPKVILCDEATTSVDLESQTAIVRLLRRINEEKRITVILTSHNRAEVGMLAHETLFIHDGRIFDALYENLFPAKLVRERDGKSVCILNDSIRIPVCSHAVGERRVLIDPRQVEIVREPRSEDPQNTIAGNLVQISMERDTVRFVLDMGILLTASTTAEHYRTLQTMVGDRVTVKIGADAVRIL